MQLPKKEMILEKLIRFEIPNLQIGQVVLVGNEKFRHYIDSLRLSEIRLGMLHDVL